MFGKPSKPVKGGKAEASNERLQVALKILRELTEKSPGSGKVKIARLELCELILPKIMKDVNKEGTTEADFEAAKDYAFAAAQMVGILAGFTLQEAVMDGAIGECMNEAKAAAKFINEGLKKRGKFVIPEGVPDLSAKPSTSAEDASRVQQRAMILDLEKQAANEKDPAMAATLRIMADRIRREINGEIKEHVA